MYEGSVVKIFRSLHNLLREMTLAAKYIGSIELENKIFPINSTN